ncbi:MAG: universal stress protein [Wenzhouxiangella sp.]|nr:universal stress protein [Wenzhouxiangella sp.]MCH8478993.1 universal stress protein [Wenzhouxiangella sp.]TVR97690.1 MAG: universal stress protein [Wenzhouxiangellaceae bacterium]
MDFRHTSIVIAIDDAGSAGRALDRGLELAEALRLPVRLVHVARTAPNHSAEVRRIDINDIGQVAGGQPEYELAAELLKRALARGGERAVEIEPVVLGGDPADAMLRYLDDCDRPILVVGRRGQGQLAQLLLGSVSDKLVRHAKCPVMVIS